jgi:hypothetical protein
MGNFLPGELEAGAVGTMPPGDHRRVHAVCDRYASGDPPGGDEVCLRRSCAAAGVAAAGPARGEWRHDGLGAQALLVRRRAAHDLLPGGEHARAGPVMARVWQHVQRAGLLVARARRTLTPMGATGTEPARIPPPMTRLPADALSADAPVELAQAAAVGCQLPPRRRSMAGHSRVSAT